MKLCRLPAAACFLTVLFAAGRVSSAAQAAALTTTHPDIPKIRVGNISSRYFESDLKILIRETSVSLIGIIFSSILIKCWG